MWEDVLFRENFVLIRSLLLKFKSWSLFDELKFDRGKKVFFELIQTLSDLILTSKFPHISNFENCLRVFYCFEKIACEILINRTILSHCLLEYGQCFKLIRLVLCYLVLGGVFFFRIDGENLLIVLEETWKKNYSLLESYN